MHITLKVWRKETMEKTEMKQGKLFEGFINQYSLSKTLRFELRPVGRTKEFIERDGIIAEDTQKAEDYIKVKKIIEEFFYSHVFN